MRQHLKRFHGASYDHTPYSLTGLLGRRLPRSTPRPHKSAAVSCTPAKRISLNGGSAWRLKCIPATLAVLGFGRSTRLQQGRAKTAKSYPQTGSHGESVPGTALPTQPRRSPHVPCLLDRLYCSNSTASCRCCDLPVFPCVSGGSQAGPAACGAMGVTLDTR